ncbi:MAG: fructose-bisphosphatase class II, partial [Methylocystis sp.]|nr:fructose-bisphosphatase class II [Methylocystis sp.]
VTGVTAGPLVGGVSLGKTTIDTETIVYRSATGTIRRIHATHRAVGKFD